MTPGKYVFVSYSSKDADFMKNITGLLEVMKIEYWKAPEKIPPGSSYAKEINRAIENCGLFLLILSQNSQSSIWCEKEVDSALSYGRRIIPYNIDNVALEDAFRFYLNNVQMIFHTRNSSKGLNELKNLLKPLSAVNTAPAQKAEENEAAKAAPAATEFKGLDDIKFKGETYQPVKKKPEAAPRKAAPAAGSKNSRNGPAKSAVKNNALQQKEEPRFRRGMSKRELFPLNNVPKQCEFCGGKVYNDHDGVFICEDCHAENYDDYQRIENYLNENGPCPLAELSSKLNLSQRAVLAWRSHH